MTRRMAIVCKLPEGTKLLRTVESLMIGLMGSYHDIRTAPTRRESDMSASSKNDVLRCRVSWWGRSQSDGFNYPSCLCPRSSAGTSNFVTKYITFINWTHCTCLRNGAYEIQQYSRVALNRKSNHSGKCEVFEFRVTVPPTIEYFKTLPPCDWVDRFWDCLPASLRETWS